MNKNHLLPEAKVNPANILQLFESFLIEATLDKDEDIQVTTERGIIILVEVLQDKKMLRYGSLFGFKKGTSNSKRLALLNTLNTTVILSRFSMPRDSVLLAEYFLPYDKGIPSYQVINSLKLFERVTVGAIKQFDTSKLVV